jgi:Domain of unknown function (DUF4232)
MASKRMLLVVVAGAIGFAASAAAKSPAPARCTVPHLHITLVQTVGLSHHGDVIRFKNLGTACTLKGYPGVDALSASGHRVASAHRTKSGYLGGLGASRPIPLVHLGHGKTASAITEWVAPANPNSCAHATTLAITPPGAKRSVRFSPPSFTLERLCNLQVHPVVPGTSGQDR